MQRTGDHAIVEFGVHSRRPLIGLTLYRCGQPAKETFMAPLQWDRLLETCCRRDASDLLLTAGSPPMIRLRESWRTLQVPPLDIAALQVLANERLGTRPDGEVDGYAYSDFGYDDARFRAMAFGHPDTRLLLVSKYQGDGDRAQPQGAAV